MFGSPDEMIVAPATAAMAGLRAIVRIAGRETPAVLTAMFEPVDGGWPQPGEPPRCVPAVVVEPVLAEEFARLPCEVLCWPGPAGPLGGPLAEVQLPGSPPLVAAVVEAACRARRRGCGRARSRLY